MQLYMVEESCLIATYEEKINAYNEEYKEESKKTCFNVVFEIDFTS